MKWIPLFFSSLLTLQGTATEDFVSKAEQKHGAFGKRAAEFLVVNMPKEDKASVSETFLLENLDLAIAAREQFPWAKSVPDELFLNDVLPYAVFDETRDEWRRELLEIATPLVKEAKTATEAAQALNKNIFNVVNVHYNTGRKRPNQSLKESKELSMATCTGLSIILVEACRAVGIPARAVGTPLWTNGRGNHTWVEIWDQDWHFTGADEYNAAGLNKGWFVGDASKAQAHVRRHAIYATSWKRDGLTFPMVWARNDESVAAVNVTERYSKGRSEDNPLVELGVRLWNQKGGQRLSAKVCILDGVRRACALDKTKAGTADLNDMPRFYVEPNAKGWLQFTINDERREIPFGPLTEEITTVDAVWTDLAPISENLSGLRNWLGQTRANRRADDPILETPLSKNEAESVAEWFYNDRVESEARRRMAEYKNKEITLEGKTLKWMVKEYGETPNDGRSLWISMHGGGGAPPAVNDRQWQNQIRLYEPEEGHYVAPRAPTDTWNLWHQGHIDPLFQQLIEDFVIFGNVNPNKVYLMGYSAGGDGVWQLAPRMADRYAAVAMMAGHPNETTLEGVRNLPFALFMGGDDSAYQRNQKAVEKTDELKKLQASDPEGYTYFSRIYEGLGHWMNKRDAEALPWMAQFQRDAWPKKIVWKQDDVTHRRFYWLGLPEAAAIPDRALVTAEIKGQHIKIKGDLGKQLLLNLSDELLDLDKPITVDVNKKKVFSGKVARTARAIMASVELRLDRPAVATGSVRLELN